MNRHAFIRQYYTDIVKIFLQWTILDLIAISNRFLHRYFLWLLMAAYLFAFFFSGPGLFIRNISFGRMVLPGGAGLQLSASLVMLSFLLFNAGLAMKVDELKGVAAKPGITLASLVANTLVPLSLVFLLSAIFGNWHEASELQNLLTGLALIVAMPVAGSSAAWAQNASGNLALSLALVLLSASLSPLVTPFTLQSCSAVIGGHLSGDLRNLASQGADAFMFITVVLPVLAGIVVSRISGLARIQRVLPALKLVNYVFLLTLNYSNAAVALPKTLVCIDWDAFALTVVMTALVCSVSFLSGWLICRAFRSGKAEAASLMFGLGMNNNGTALVIAAAMLSDHPQVMLPLIFYTLAQQIIAAFIDHFVARTA